MDKLNECIIVAGKRDDNYFLAKNRDRNFITEYTIKHNLYKNIEIVYSEDSVGHIEGMNEFGVGYIYAYLNEKPTQNYKWRSTIKMHPFPPINSSPGIDKKSEELKQIMRFKNAENAVEYLKTLHWFGNYFIGDTKGIWEIEHFEQETEVRRCTFKNIDFKVKTNFGDLIKTAGHLDGYEEIQRGNSEVRKIEAKRYLLGFKNYTEVLKRLGQQTFTNSSSLNVFRTDEHVITVNQVLMDLNNKEFQFVHYDETSKFNGVETDLPKGYQPKIHIHIRDKKEFDKGGEWDRFIQKKNSVFNHFKNFKPDY